MTDLSDPNRPIKLGERFVSVYEDEWSEALEEIGIEEDGDEDDEEELKSNQKLLDVVKLAYKFCKREATAQTQKIAMGMTDVSLQGQAVKTHGKGTMKQPPSTQTAGAKKKKPEQEKASTVESSTWSYASRFAESFLKETASNSVPQIQQLFKDFYIKEIKLKSVRPLPETLEKYIDRCVELTWLMSVQDPPMDIKWVENGARSDTNYFKFYQSKGKIVKQCVWPAVFLSAQGDIVSKGVIIGMAP